MTELRARHGVCSSEAAVARATNGAMGETVSCAAAGEPSQNWVELACRASRGKPASGLGTSARLPVCVPRSAPSPPPSSLPPPPAGACNTYHCYKGGPEEPPEGLETGGCPVYSHPAQVGGLAWGWRQAPQSGRALTVCHPNLQKSNPAFPCALLRSALPAWCGNAQRPRIPASLERPPPTPQSPLVLTTAPVH